MKKRIKRQQETDQNTTFWQIIFWIILGLDITHYFIGKVLPTIKQLLIYFLEN